MARDLCRGGVSSGGASHASLFQPEEACDAAWGFRILGDLHGLDLGGGLAQFMGNFPGSRNFQV